MFAEYARVASITFFAALVLVPVARRLALLWGAVDQPNARKVHDHPMPRLGGIGIWAAFMLGITMTVGWDRQTAAIAAAATILTLVGALDDRFSLPAKWKFAVQLFAAVVVVVFGVHIDKLSWIGGPVELPFWLAAILTVGWIVTITNAINLIDGLDGLAAGVSGIATITIFAVDVAVGSSSIALMLCAALFGAVAGFLPYNWHPARVFMGDSGSLTIGFLVAVFSVLGTTKAATTVSVMVPLLILGVPIFDTLTAVVRRALWRRPIFQPDKMHLHHQLLALGLSHRQVVLTIYGVCAVLGGGAVALTYLSTPLGTAIVAALFVGLLIAADKVGLRPVPLQQPGAQFTAPPGK